MTKRSSVTELV